MGIMDNVKDMASNNSEEMKKKIAELEAKKDEGKLDDAGREQLAKLKEHFGK